MGFIADVRLGHDELPLVPTMKRQPDVTLRREYESATDGSRVLFVSAFGDGYASLEETLADDPTVSEPTCVATFGHRAIYRLAVETGLAILPDWCAEHGLYVFTVTSDRTGWVARIHLPDRDALAAIRRRYRERGVSFRVDRLHDSSAADDGTYFLTDHQRDLLLMAYEAGYFDIPRRVTQDELAERLEVSDSAVSQQLRRAISTLIAATLENGRPVDDPV
ncbi:Predicted DNA binding protein, contains HTH domain [Halobiforma haloterrestris]|uniref:Predicted DNA binding protein, contains HTH domain n=1 Tax=Natronobacterium haloterrestre TaxID=148448 RepID=A0A1I1HCN1_NATHA|nr:helix-turn-helix domain-containing protein [Halobiforma haloterrestris]SFC19233.1 Predicted DNA binding protein, contains HTH domain [Halobiforma haloterrestris]